MRAILQLSFRTGSVFAGTCITAELDMAHITKSELTQIKRYHPI